MEDSFRVRVDKTFGTLGGTTPSAVGVTPALWSLTDEEIERREWIPKNKEEDDGGESGPSGRRIQLDSDLNDLSDCEDEDDELEDEEDVEEEDDAIDSESKKRGLNSVTGAETSVDEYLDVRSNIGRDCTLDYEEEEDQYDKLAVGTEKTGDRVYMRDVKSSDYGIYENEYVELPETLHAAFKDPRANHTAAKIRLKEDAEAAGNFDTLQLTDNSSVTNVVKPEEDNIKKGEVIDGGDNPKPILKKRENLMDSKSQKRVRFIVDSASSIGAQLDEQLSGGSDLASETQMGDDCEVPKQASDDLSQYNSSPGLPDYLRNPSRYTRYTFDPSDDVDEQSNRKAFMDLCFNRSRETKTDPSLDETSAEIRKLIVFTPRRKQEDESMEDKTDAGGDNLNTKKKKKSSIVIEDIGESEISPMEEDKIDVVVDGGSSSQRSGRKYRVRSADEDTCN